MTRVKFENATIEDTYSKVDMMNFGEWLLFQNLKQPSFTLKELKEGIPKEVIDGFLYIDDLFNEWKELRNNV